jgi:hypothetical protein
MGGAKGVEDEELGTQTPIGLTGKRILQLSVA